jgi:hypothetical protein
MQAQRLGFDTSSLNSPFQLEIQNVSAELNYRYLNNLSENPAIRKSSLLTKPLNPQQI